MTRSWRSYGLLLPLAIGLVCGAAHVFFAQPATTSIHAQGADDAYISFRYAENLVRGEGLVYNPGERVEGYSNLLHVLISAALLLLVERDQLFFAVSLVNLVWLVVALVVFHRVARRRLGSEAAFGVTVLMALAPSLWIWAGSGMETVGVLALQLALWWLIETWDDEGPQWRTLALVTGATLLIRTDGFVLIAIAVGYWLWRRQARRALFMAAAAAPFLVLHFAWRLYYYGRLLPNTYYAKVSGPLDQRVANALGNLSDLAVDRGLLLWLLASLFVFAWELAKPRSASFGPFFASGVVAYWLYVGGDHFGDRFLLLVIPIGIVALTELFRRTPSRSAWVFLAVLALVIQLRPVAQATWFDYVGERYDGWITLGRYLGEHYDDALLAVDAAGKIPFFADLPSIDMRGLVDARIGSVEVEEFRQPGHNKLDPDYVLSRRPELIATWIWPDLRAGAGLTRELYEAAGYRIALLANTTPRSKQEDVLDVSGLNPREVAHRIREGYRLVVLVRQGP